MKPTIAKLTILSLLVAPLSALALKSDANKPLNIESNSQALDLNTNTVTFSGNVVVTQGTLKLNASRVIIKRLGDSKSRKELITAYGSPVTFQQEMDNGKLLKGKANRASYNTVAENLTLTGDAELTQESSSIKGQKIIYNVAKQSMSATGDSKSRIQTVLYPEQLRQSKP